jgi:DNA-binding transcriptional LysR family regulator
MDRSLIPNIPIVLAVARHRNFARAAAELGLGASAVSHAVRAVEAFLGEPIFVRTTRSVSPTASGQRFAERMARAFEEIEAAAAEMQASRGDVSGLLRLNAPHLVALHVLRPIVAELSRRHPRLTVELVSDNALTDVVGQGFDGGVRLGEMIAADMIAHRLTPPFKMVMAAAPAYLAKRGTVATLADLSGHNCIGYRLLGSGAIYEWEFVDGEGKDVAVAVAGSVRVSEAALAHELALDGVGIAYLADFLLVADIAAGRLVQVLPETALTEPGFFLYYPQRSAGAPKLKAFLEAARSARLALPGTTGETPANSAPDARDPRTG